MKERYIILVLGGGFLKVKKMKAIKKYWKSCWAELTKVTWPTKNQAVRLTIIVILMCVAIAIFLGVIDYGFSELHTFILEITA
jgi:preprotein translocase subunit SecE